MGSNSFIHLKSTLMNSESCYTYFEVREIASPYQTISTESRLAKSAQEGLVQQLIEKYTAIDRVVLFGDIGEPAGECTNTAVLSIVGISSWNWGFNPWDVKFNVTITSGDLLAV
jgi:hypothetical protein